MKKRKLPSMHSRTPEKVSFFEQKLTHSEALQQMLELQGMMSYRLDQMWELLRKMDATMFKSNLCPSCQGQGFVTINGNKMNCVCNKPTPVFKGDIR